MFPLEKKGCRRTDEEPVSAWNSSAAFPERSRLILPDQADCRSSSQERAFPAMSPRRKPEPHMKSFSEQR